jgi:hypothetical protein
MWKLVKIAIVLLVLNAAWHLGTSYWRFYSFEDQVRDMAVAAGSQTEDALRASVVRIAGENAIPLAPEDMTLRRDPGLVLVTAAYTENVEIFPRYFYAWRHEMDMRVYAMGAAPPPSR